jgi:hypothetical protein
MERVFPVLEGLLSLLVEVDRTGRPASVRLICRVIGADGDEDLPMVSVWATSGDGNPVDRCVELAEKLAAAEAELAKLREGLPKWHEWRDGDYSLMLANKASIGGVTREDGRWRCAPAGTNITRHASRDDAMRALEKALGLPVCEVLP